MTKQGNDLMQTQIAIKCGVKHTTQRNIQSQTQADKKHKKYQNSIAAETD